MFTMKHAQLLRHLMAMKKVVFRIAQMTALMLMMPVFVLALQKVLSIMGT
jgi:hypothetical protein